MANIPGMFSRLPSCDPIIPMSFGDSEGMLTTDDYGGKFIVEGNVRIIALAILKYALTFKEGMQCKGMQCIGMSFSQFEFDFKDGISIKPRRETNKTHHEQVSILIEEMYKILKMKVFL